MIKQSQRMFQTFGLEKAIATEFMRIYNELMKAYRRNPNDLAKKFSKDGSIYLGEMDISDGLRKIFDAHGQPKNVKAIPMLNFLIVYPDSKEFKKYNITNTNAFFYVNNGIYYFVKVARNIFDIFENTSKSIEDTAAHELQHLIRFMYIGKKASEYGKQTAADEEGQAEQYFTNHFEIQSKALDVARKVMNSIKEMYSIVARNYSPEKMEKVNNNFRNNKPDFLRQLMESARMFLARAEKRMKKPFRDDIRKQYYKAVIYDFDKLYDEWTDTL